MIVLVTGGRDYRNKDRLYGYMDRLGFVVDMVIQGGATGADNLAKHWARKRGIHCAQVDAMWELGRGAGPARNYAMLLLKPDLVIAFAGGVGTAHMKRIALKAGIEVREVE